MKENPNIFVGEHSSVMINLEYVAFARGGRFAGSDIEVTLTTGSVIRLEDQSADMFRAFVNKITKWAPTPPPFPSQ